MADWSGRLYWVCGAMRAKAAGCVGVVAASVCIAILGGGCACPRPDEIPAPDSGRFLTIEEQKTLNDDELEAYCQSLGDYMAQLRGDIKLARAMTESLEVVLDSLNAQHSQANREARVLEQELKKLKVRRKGASEYTVREGDTLIKLSSLFYGTAADWRRIYVANRDKIDSPGAALTPGLRLLIPN